VRPGPIAIGVIVAAEAAGVVAGHLAHPVASTLLLLLVPGAVWLFVRFDEPPHVTPARDLDDTGREPLPAEQSWVLGAVADAARRDAGLDVADAIEHARDLGVDQADINLALSRGRAAREVGL
jgi:hypothetical protein